MCLNSIGLIFMQAHKLGCSTNILHGDEIMRINISFITLIKFALFPFHLDQYFKSSYLLINFNSPNSYHSSPCRRLSYTHTHAQLQSLFYPSVYTKKDHRSGRNKSSARLSDYLTYTSYQTRHLGSQYSHRQFSPPSYQVCCLAATVWQWWNCGTCNTHNE